MKVSIELAGQTVYLLVDCQHYPGVFTTRERAQAAAELWREYTGNRPQITHMTLDEFSLSRYAAMENP